MDLSRSANSGLVLAAVRRILGDTGVARVVTEMADISISHIDPLVDEEILNTGLQRMLQNSAELLSTKMWQLPDGTKKAKVRLPAKQAALIDGKKLMLSYCVSNISIVAPIPTQQQRCYRCWELGHFARDC